MKSLKDQACIDIVKRNNWTLQQFLAVLENPTNNSEAALVNACSSNNSLIWKLLIDKDYSPSLLLARMDISPQLYSEFARRLSHDDIFDYVVIIEHQDIDVVVRGPSLIDNAPRTVDQELLNEDEEAIYFTVIGAQPAKGSLGYVVTYEMNYEVAGEDVIIPNFNPNADQTFIVGSNPTKEDLSELYMRVKMYLAAKYMIAGNIILPKYMGTAGGIDINDNHYAELPTPTEFSELFDQYLMDEMTNLSVFDHLKSVFFMMGTWPSDTERIDDVYIYMGIGITQVMF
jgi:hypothetical protein